MPPLSRLSHLVAGCALLAALSTMGCRGGVDAPAAPTAATSAAPSVPASTAATAADTPIPATAEAADGPRRIVSLSAMTTRMLLTLGRADRIVGRASNDPTALPAPASGTPPAITGTMAEPDVDAIERLDPDLVVGVVGAGTDGAFFLAKTRKVPFVALRTDGLADIARAWQRVGEAVGLPEAGNERAAEFIAACDAAVSITPPEPGPEVVVIHQHTPLMVAGLGSYGHDLITGNGAVNAAQGAETRLAHWPDALLLAAAPDVVLDFSPQRHDPEAIRAFATRFAELRAVKAGRVHAAPRATIAPDLGADADVAWVNRALYGTLAQPAAAPGSLPGGTR